MFQLGLEEIKKKPLYLGGFFIFFMFMHTILDWLNMPYQDMIRYYGVWLVVINIVMNVLMSILTAILLTLSVVHASLRGTETKGQNAGFLAMLFGVLTYGCTPCVISFFASIGISFGVMVLPFAGLPYKFIALLIIVAGLFFTRYEMNKPCPIPQKEA